MTAETMRRQTLHAAAKRSQLAATVLRAGLLVTGSVVLLLLTGLVRIGGP